MIVLFSWIATSPLSAHSGRVHLPFDLPACTARALVCEVPVPSQTQITSERPSQMAERSCLDGTGVPRSCAMTGPFQYMPQNLAFEKGNVTAAQLFPAMGETLCVDGMAGPYPCSNIDLLSSLPVDNMGGTRGNDLWGWSDPDGGGEYVIMGLSDGTAFVDISDATNPLYLGVLPSEDGKESVWRDVKVYGNHAFIVVDDFRFIPRSHGMQVFDLTQLPAAASTPLDLPLTFTTTVLYDEIHVAHNIAINEETGYAYLVGSRQAADSDKQCNAGLHMVDVTTPTSPTFAGCFSTDGYTHDTQCVIYQGPDAEYQGREICFNSNEDTLTIVDVTLKNNPEQISKAHYLTFCAEGVAEDCNRDEMGNLAFYTHQGWLTEDHTYFVQNDELDEIGMEQDGSNGASKTRTYMWNLQDLDNPQYMGNYTAAISSLDHNLYIRDQYVFESNYSSGLRILDARRVSSAQLAEVAYFDTYPTANNLGSSGAWSSYPFFDSGVVAVSTIGEGLFLLRPSLSPASIHIYMPLVQK